MSDYNKAVREKEPQGISNFFYRTYTYLTSGYSFISAPLSLFSIASVIWLVLGPYPPLVFIHYKFFLVIVFSVGIPISIFVGWWLNRRSHFATQQQKVAVQTNPYNVDRLTEKERMMWPVTYSMALWLKATGHPVPQESINWMELVAKLNGVDLSGTRTIKAEV